MTDVELLHKHRRGGSEDPFAELTRRHIGWIFGVARRRVGDSHLAEDVAQAVFILLHRKAPAFADDRALVAWLHRTTFFASNVAARQRERRRKHETEAAMQRQMIEHSADDPQWSELAPLLDEMIERLRSDEREAILLRFYRQMTFAQIAAAIGSTEEAVRKRVTRAIDKLRQRAAAKGLTLDGEKIAAGLDMEATVGSIAPAGLAAVAAGAALTNNLAVGAAGIPIAKGAIAMMFWTKAKLVAGVALAVVFTAGAGVVLVAAQHASQRDAETRADKKDYPKLAPYTAIRWKDAAPEVQINDTWYAWLAINDTPVEKIVEAAKAKYRGDEWQRRIGEDLVEVVGQMGQELAGEVTMKVRTLDTNETRDLSKVPNTHENRQRVWKARQAKP